MMRPDTKAKTGRADMALNLINKLYGIERDLKEAGGSERLAVWQQRSQLLLDQLKAGLDKASRRSPERPGQSGTWPATGAGWCVTSKAGICRSTTTVPRTPSGRS